MQKTRSASNKINKKIKAIKVYLIFNLILVFTLFGGCLSKKIKLDIPALPIENARGQKLYNLQPQLAFDSSKDSWVLIALDIFSPNQSSTKLIQHIPINIDNEFIPHIANTNDPTAVANYQIGTNDLNFDGIGDVSIVLNCGTSNCMCEYWLSKPDGTGLKHLGEYTCFEINNKDKKLSTYERGGYAGLEYESKEYFFEGDKLVVCKSLSQRFYKSEADTSYFLLTEITRPPYTIMKKEKRIKVYLFSADSTIIDTITP